MHAEPKETTSSLTNYFSPITLHHYFNVKSGEVSNGKFLRMALDGLFLVDVNTGRSSVLT